MDERPESGPVAPESDAAPEYPGTTPEYWRGIDDRRRLLATIGVVALGIALVTVFVAWSILAHRAAQSAADKAQGVTPAEETSKTPPAAGAAGTGTVTATQTLGVPGVGTPGPGGPTGTGAAGAGTGVQVSPARAARVAYRRGGWLCVADEDGSNERRVVASDAGVFALSPDGATLACVTDVGVPVLVLADVTTGRAVTVGPAQQDRPSWAPDSSWLAYTAPGPEVRRVQRDGTGARVLFAGSLPAVASAAEIVVGAASGEVPAVVVWMAGKSIRLAAEGPVSGLACDGGRVYYGTATSSAGGASLRAVNLGGTHPSALVAAPAATRAVSLCHLVLAPDGSTISYAECGDDGYSRVFVVPVGGGTPTPLSTRRDTYPLGWTADGSRVILIEGNAFQGEATALLGVAPDGSARTRLVEGAGR